MGRCSRSALGYAFPLSLLTTSMYFLCSRSLSEENPSRLVVPLLKLEYFPSSSSKLSISYLIFLGNNKCTPAIRVNQVHVVQSCDNDLICS